MIEQIKAIVKEAMLEAEATEEAVELATEAETAAAEDPSVEAPATEVATVEAVMPASTETAMEEVVEAVDLQEVEETAPSAMAQKISRMSQEVKDDLLVKLAEALYETKKESVMSAIRSDLKERLIAEDKAVDFYQVFLANKQAYLSTMSALGKPASKVASIKPTRTTPVADSIMSGAGNVSPIERALADSKAGKGSFIELMNKYSR
jgi:hypothetical protein